jgi:hypothetical protein
MAFGLGIFTVVYNLAEGLVSIYFGLSDGALTLFGFGADSFIEVFSALGILHMIWRLKRHGSSQRDLFERTALRITGVSFYLLALFLVASAALNLATGRKPETAFWGILIGLVSISFMGLLIVAKTRVGRALDSAPILADAACSKVCLWMSLVLLASSGIYAVTGFPWVDTLGAAGLAWFSFREGRECMEKARGMHTCSCETD